MICQSKKHESRLWVLEWVLLTILLGLLAWANAPDVNEAHYLAKAKHFWDRTFCPNDIFVSSHESHWFFYLTHGWLCRVFEFETSAWIGRVFAWMVTAWGLLELSRGFFGRFGVGILVGGLVVVLNLELNLAGEWFVGGVEGKCYAYGFAFAAIARWNRRQVSAGFLFLGIACAFHIVVGLWFAIAVGSSLVLTRLFFTSAAEPGLVTSHEVERNNLPDSARSSPVAIMICLAAFAFFVIGFVPAISQNGSVSVETVTLASKAQSLSRLAHHQLATEFGRWHLFVPLLAAWVLLWFACRSSHESSNAQKISIARLNAITLASILVAAIGVVTSIIAVTSEQDWLVDYSARLLTLYLFRLADVLVPLACVVNGVFFWLSLPMEVRPTRAMVAIVALAFAFCAVRNCTSNFNDPRSASAGQSIDLPKEEALRKREVEAEANWIRTCKWIRQNTDSAAVFITPHWLQTFKWYAHRSEVACRKDMPQDAGSVLQWLARMELLSGGDATALNRLDGRVGIQSVNENAILLPLAFGDQLPALSHAFHAEFLVVEQRLVDYFVSIRRFPECLEQIYPEPGERKSTYVVFRIQGASLLPK